VSWRWRQRRRLLARRAALAAPARRAASQRIGRALAEAFPGLGQRGAVVGFCWPYRGEPDVRPAVRRFVEGGARAALPVVRGRGEPLAFLRWAPAARWESPCPRAAARSGRPRC
jgi:5-formyltetrahydrofolate cyclo-ligase